LKTAPGLKTGLRRAGLAAGLAVLGAGGCGSVDNRPAEWAYISPALFQPNCATTSCHSPAAAVSGLDFSTPDSGYISLTRLWLDAVTPGDAGTSDVPCPTAQTVGSEQICYLRPLVTPYDPEGSRVVNMLLARDAPRMPPDRPLPADDIRLVERWILNGACRVGATCPSDAGPDGSAGATDGTVGN
jgi:hypothetical protein